MVNDETLKLLLELEAKATKEPWMAWNMPSAGWQIGTKRRHDNGGGYGDIASIMFYQSRPGHDGGPFIPDWLHELDATEANLIAEARNHVRPLIEEIRRLQMTLIEAKEYLASLRGYGAVKLADKIDATLRGEQP